MCDELTEYYDCIIIIFEVLKMYNFFVDLVKRSVLTHVSDVYGAIEMTTIIIIIVVHFTLDILYSLTCACMHIYTHLPCSAVAVMTVVSWRQGK